MKIIYLYIYVTLQLLFLGGGTGELFSQSSSQNYVRTRTYTTETGTVYLDAIQYFDGLGRPNQAVQVGASPQKKDIISIQEYDAFGRESSAWLPGLSSGNGAFVNFDAVKTSAKSENADQAPFSKPVYEASPLNRVLEQYAPGADWHTKEKSVKTAYKTNVSGDNRLNCILYKVGGTRQTPTLSKSGNYTTGELYVTELEDENGNVSYEFKDKLGQVVLTRQIDESDDKLDTYYVYDDFGNLCFVLPPLVANTTTFGENADIMKQYAYLYKYDNRNRCIWKRLPGCEPMYYVYDKGDRLIFSQDGEQRVDNKNEWTFSIPDAFGRIVLAGVCVDTIPVSNELIKAEFKSGGVYKGYNILVDSSITSLTNNTILSVNYYDNYSYLGLSGGIPNDANTAYNSETGYGVRYDEGKGYEAKGQLTGTMIAQYLPDGTISPTYLYSVMYYDNRGRLIQTKSNNHLEGGIEKEYIAYNFTGQPTKRKHIHSATNKTTQTEVYAYSYDHAGRLTKTTHQLNGAETIILVKNTYDELGRFQTSKKNDQTDLTTTYTYNVRSWTKSISSPLFIQNLYYNEAYGGSDPQYNGNISAMDWTTTEDKNRGYAFAYDALSRLTAANYLESGMANNSYKTAYSYDKHGNILTTERYGRTTSDTYGLIDSITMTYNGNQLLTANDAVPIISITESADFKNYSDESTEYLYNANGAMYKDLNKGISNIAYNSLNLPQMMDIKSPVAEARNEYTYTATGTKRRVVQKWNPAYSTTPIIGSAINVGSLTKTETTDYVGNIIYETRSDGISKTRILIDGGYIENGAYHFYLTDHLGNNRVVANANGTVVQKNHYYPFGIAFAEGTSTEQGKQPYKYNGKELDQMHGLNMYDYSARYMEPAIGKFTSVDPHAENYFSWSPYAYCGNNPIKRIDPTGMDWYEDEDGNALWHPSSDKTYEDKNGKIWNNIGTEYIVAGKTSGTLFKQRIGKNGQLVLYSISLDMNSDGSYIESSRLDRDREAVRSWQSSDASRSAQQRFWDNPTMGNWLKYLITEVASQYTDPYKVVGGLSAGVAGYSSVTRPLRSAKTSVESSHQYAPRVRARGVQDPVSHNFPYSFDDPILVTTPQTLANGYRMYQLRGSMNGKAGFFEIGKTKDGIINHRFFRPD